MPEMLQLAPEITVPAPEDGALLRFDSDAVEQVRGFFSLLVFGQNEWAGKPFTLTQWEDTGIREFYGTFGDKLPRELLTSLEELESKLAD